MPFLSFLLLLLVSGPALGRPLALSYPGFQEASSRPTARPAEFDEEMQQGRQALQERNFQEAIQRFKRAVAIDPRSAEAHMFLGFAYRVGGSYELLGEAKAELRQALALDPSLVWARLYLGRIYLDLGRTRDAREELEQCVQQNPSMPQAHALLGEIYRQEGSLEKALQAAQKARELSPELIDARYYLGLIYRDLGRLEEAGRELQVAARSPQANADIFHGLSDVYSKTGQYARAVAALEEGLKLDPSRPDLHMELATAYRELGKKNDAREELNWLYANEKQFLGTVYFEQLSARMRFEDGLLAELDDDQELARARFHEVLELLPDHGGAHNRLAEIYFEQKFFQKAFHHARKAKDAGHPIDPKILDELEDHLNEEP